MPELPEVETTLQGIKPHLLNQKISSISVYQPQLRWLIPDSVSQIHDCIVIALERRAKYLLIHLDNQHTLIIHLGMSGSLQFFPVGDEKRKHDHVIFHLNEQQELRYHDPRRFGCMLIEPTSSIFSHPLLVKLGPEPLSANFNAPYLIAIAKKRNKSIKTLIMDQHVVVGVGNIYACEALFNSGINPTTICSKVPQKKLKELVKAIYTVLVAAISQGGTTLRDFTQTDHKPGYFAQQLNVYGRANQPCPTCGIPIVVTTIGQRSTFYCPVCQK